MTNPNKSNEAGGTMSDIREKLKAIINAYESATGERLPDANGEDYRIAQVILNAAQASIATPQPQSVRGALEQAAKVADDRAQKHALEADRAEANGEHDEVSNLKSTAWNISIVAHEIRALIEPLSAATGGQESEAQDEHMPETSAALQMAQESAALEEFGMKVASAVRQECQDRMEVDSYGLPDDEYLRSAIVNSLIGEKK